MKNKIVVISLVFLTILLLFGGSILPCTEAKGNFVKNKVSINNDEDESEISPEIYSIYFVDVSIDCLPKNCYDYKLGLPLLRMPKSFVYGFKPKS